MLCSQDVTASMRHPLSLSVSLFNLMNPTAPSSCSFFCEKIKENRWTGGRVRRAASHRTLTGILTLLASAPFPPVEMSHVMNYTFSEINRSKQLLLYVHIFYSDRKMTLDKI